MNRFSEEMEAFEAYLKELFSAGHFASRESMRLIMSGGKRLRPAVVISLALTSPHYCRKQVFDAAASIELVHSASLVHDDIIDDASLRRGQTTLHSQSGVHLALFTGDFLLARATQLILTSGVDHEKASLLSKGVEGICLGEIEQYLGRKKTATASEYLKRISRKTGILFGAACTLGAHLGEMSERQAKLAGHFGLSYGVAYQLKDDLTDFGYGSKMDKPLFGDLKEGIYTLPLILALSRESGTALLLGEINRMATEEQQKRLIALMEGCGAIDDTNLLMERYLCRGEKLLSSLPDGEGKEYLAFLCEGLRK